MREKLIIKNFGPIKKMSFDFRKINILIGEQSTGKSTVAKLIAAINNMVKGETLTAGSLGLMKKDEYGKIKHFKRHLKIFEIDNYIRDSTTINYNHVLFDFEYSKGDCSINKKKTTDGTEVSLDWLNTTFIPADRAAVNLLSIELLLSLNQLNQDLPGYFVIFGQLFNRLKKKQGGFDFSDTLGVAYKYENDLDKIKISDNREIKMAEASSAIQTNTPLLVVLSHQSQIDPYQGFASSDLNLTVIEEPELNSFPLLQNSILKYIARSIRPDKDIYLRRIISTTHSPYILTSLNNLMYAYEIGKNDHNKAKEIVEEKYWLNPDDVSAYMLLPNGNCENIVDKKENMIKAEKIDSVSKTLNEEFDALLNIEFVKK